MLDWIIKYWVQWLFGLICAALLAGYRRYHALGGNGTGTELYNRAKALPIRND